MVADSLSASGGFMGCNWPINGVQPKKWLIHGMQPIKWPIHGVNPLVADSLSASGPFMGCSLRSDRFIMYCQRSSRFMG